MRVPEATSREDTSRVRLLHDLAKIHATYDDPDLVPVMALACRAGLLVLAEEPRRATSGQLPHHQRTSSTVLPGGCGRVPLSNASRPSRSEKTWAPSTLGSFLRGNVLQLGKVHRLLLAELARLAPLLPGRQTLAFIAIDSQQNGSTAARARCRVRLYEDPRQEPAGPRAERAARGIGCGGIVVVRADWSSTLLFTRAARAAGAFFSVTVPMNPHVAAAIQPIRAAVVSTVTLRRFRS
jgi:hypothetical protein